MMNDRRVKFYSVQDLSSGWNLKGTEVFFQHWDENIKKTDIGTILELYNIKQYFDADMRLMQWSDAQFTDYKGKCALIPRILCTFFSSITDSNLETLCKSVDWEYIDDFWQLIVDYKVYRRISPAVIENIVECDDKAVWPILQHHNLVASFGQVLPKQLAHNRYTAEKLISHYLVSDENNASNLNFPAEFTHEMKNSVICDYINREDANINYLQVLEHAQSSREFPVSDKLKLRARKSKEALQESIFAGATGISSSIEISVKSMPNVPFELTYNDLNIAYSYSREWIEKNLDYPTLLNNFIYLFGYVDEYFRCTFVSLYSDLGVFERYTDLRGKKDYMTGAAFYTKRTLNLLQIATYNQELKRHNIRLEEIFKWFFVDYLKQEFGAEGFTYSPSSAGTTYLEKCKLLAIAIDGVLKQYRLFCEEGYVDRELLEISSGHIIFSSVPSTMPKKYAYSNSKELQTEMFLLYSDQSNMNYTKKTHSEYKSLPDLLRHEKMKIEDFAKYQQSDLDWLINRGAIQTSKEGYLEVNKARVAVLKDLFHHEVICPTYYGNKLKQQVESFVASGDMRYEETLFSKPEQDYLNYVLNKSAFSNGLDLRNRYSHDTCSLDEKTQSEDYLEFQRIMVLIIIKINEEFCSSNQI